MSFTELPWTEDELSQAALLVPKYTSEDWIYDK
jgi:hypothetical protein